jgi:FKBP-type peptidyl-prolyl cis-trans isomerase FkpA
MSKKIFLLLPIIVLFSFCKKAKTDQQKIEDYVAANNLHGTYTASGLFYTIDAVGAGGSPTIDNTVRVEYAGYLLDGTKFDNTPAGVPASFPLTQVIEGWQEGIPKYQKGGRGKLVIPSALGYGTNRVQKIPVNSILIFDVYLVDWN